MNAPVRDGGFLVEWVSGLWLLHEAAISGRLRRVFEGLSLDELHSELRTHIASMPCQRSFFYMRTLSTLSAAAAKATSVMRIEGFPVHVLPHKILVKKLPHKKVYLCAGVGERADSPAMTVQASTSP